MMDVFNGNILISIIMYLLPSQHRLYVHSSRYLSPLVTNLLINARISVLDAHYQQMLCVNDKIICALQLYNDIVSNILIHITQTHDVRRLNTLCSQLCQTRLYFNHVMDISCGSSLYVDHEFCFS